eukprot:TRINITY_DN14120_c0_g1_i1.p2 TRINITY_DN14120_c0_g1~~TRINITY_DN14120_c0_g1_i1.p2  ORF type:complete len:188 (+),score=35.51 TRINITY_DN14120_c0_g1_i1:52-615(+)
MAFEGNAKGKGRGWNVGGPGGDGGAVDPRMLGLMNLAGKGGWTYGGGGWSVMKGKGKGFKGFNGFKGYNGYKGMRNEADALRVDPELKVWIGNLAPSTKWNDLRNHVDAIVRSKWVEVLGGNGAGTAAVVFFSAEDASRAIAELNGSELDGHALFFDTWVKKQQTNFNVRESHPLPADEGTQAMGTF